MMDTGIRASAFDAVRLASAIIIGLTCVLGPSESHANSPSLTVNESQYPIQITEMLTNGPVTLEREISLTAAKPGTVRIRLETFAKTTSSPEIKGSQIEILPSSITFTNNYETKTFRIRINDVAFPGAYAGALKLTFEQKEKQTSVQEDPITIQIIVTIYMRPKVNVSPSNISVNLVDCTNFISCALAEWIIPGSSRRDILLSVANTSAGRIDILLATSYLVKTAGVGRGLMLTTQPAKIDINDQSEVSVSVAEKDFLPGTYSGSLRIRVVNADEPRLYVVSSEGKTVYLDINEQTASATVNVRRGPLVPLFLIIIGVFAGRLALRLGDPRTKMQLAVYPQYLALKNAAEQLNDHRIKNFLHFKLVKIRDNINAGIKTEADITRAIAELSALIRTFAKLENFDDLIKNELADDNPRKQELIDKVAAARDDLIGGRLEDAKQKIDDLIGEISSELLPSLAMNNVMAPAQEEDLSSAFRELFEAAKLTEQGAPQTKADAFKSVAAGGYIGLMAFLTGDKAYTSVETKYWIWRPIGFVALMTTLVFQGLVINYGGDANAAFGAEGLTDYGKLLLWGVGAEVANRTLQQIKF